jgi:hypothetical protein
MATKSHRLPRVGARLRRVRSPANIPLPGPPFTLPRVGLALRANLAASISLPVSTFAPFHRHLADLHLCIH